MVELKEGMKAPLFEGIDKDGKTIRLSDYSGKKVVLYFYPKDDTPTCTTEACNLRDNYSEFVAKGFEVIGVSMDNEKSHRKFATKYSLPFPLISDTSGKIVNAYGVYRDKILFGRSLLGIVRTTFIIDEQGVIEKVISNVKSSKHTEQIFKIYNK